MMEECAPGTARLVVANEELHLFAERVVYWPRARALLVADPHWGKSASFRAAGVPVPHGTTAGGLGRLDDVIARVPVERIVFLGDFLHAEQGQAPATSDVLAAWRLRHSGIAMLVVRGNHDRHAGDPALHLGIPAVNAPLVEPPFVFAHKPTVSDGGYVLCGHLHPAAGLAGAGGLRMRLPCFWFGERMAVLPAFGDFTGVFQVFPAPGDRVFVIAGDEVLER
jgi:uncharacterized protein